jgi:hypothetical protein
MPIYMASDYEPVPPGLYTARLEEIETAESQHGTYYRWPFVIQGEGEQEDCKVYANVSDKFGPKSKARQWCEQMIGRVIRRGEQFNTDVLIGGACTASWSRIRQRMSRAASTTTWRTSVERELEALQGKRDRIAKLEQDRDALLDSLVEIRSEALDTLSPDERNQLYRILQLKVVLKKDAMPELSGVFGQGLDVCTLESQP